MLVEGSQPRRITDDLLGRIRCSEADVKHLLQKFKDTFVRRDAENVLAHKGLGPIEETQAADRRPQTVLQRRLLHHGPRHRCLCARTTGEDRKSDRVGFLTAGRIRIWCFIRWVVGRRQWREVPSFGEPVVRREQGLIRI